MLRFGIALLAAVIVGALAVACGGGGSSTTATPMGQVNTILSDPATCQAPNGPYSHVYVTVTDVLASTSSTAGAQDSPSWQDLTPKMTPAQVDLLAAPNNNCFLAMLGSQTQIPAGTYQQIRIILMDNNHGSSITGNKCQGNDANCIVLAADNSVHTLLLSSEAQTGLKIPSGQIAGGQFTVPAGQTADLDIDFNCCASIVITGNGQYRLKPVLHAGEVSIQSNASTAITGKVVDSATSQPIAGAKIVVALEQKDATGVDRVIMETVADGQGNFIFCPVAQGTYDVVVDAVAGAVGYAATVTTGVAQGTAMGNIPLIATPANGSFATIMGRVTTTTGSAATPADIQLSALQSIGGGVSATIPLAAQSSATASLTTAADVSCPANADCVSYTIQVPGMNPNIGAFAGASTTWKQDIVTPVTYTLDALAFVTMSGGTADCSPSEQKVGPVTVTPSTTVTPNPPDLVFTGCQ